MKRLPFRVWCPLKQGIAPRTTKQLRGELVARIYSKARVVSGKQESKRRELNDEIQALVSRCESAVAEEALQWNTVSPQWFPPPICATCGVFFECCGTESRTPTGMT